MRNFVIFLCLILILSTGNAFALFKPVENIESGYIKRIILSHFDDSLLYVASKNSLYKSQDSGKNFKKISVFKDEEIQHLFFDPYLADVLYIVTSRHLYRFEDGLKQLYSSPDEELIFTAIKHKGQFYIGTSKGVYFGHADVLTWRKLKTLSDSAIYHMDSDKDALYFATEKGAYSLKGQNRFKRLFVMRQAQDQEQSLVARFIKVDTFDQRRIFLGTSQGVFVSADKGLNWKKLYIEGIDNLFVNCIVQTKLETKVIYLSTTKGFFRVNLNQNLAKQIFEGLYSSHIYWAEFTSGGQIYLATSKGLFENDYFTQTHKPHSLEAILQKEPSIGEIQIEAMRYNEVHPEKTKRWRNALKYRALLPNLDVDYDKTINYDSGADRYYTGPYDWGLSFSWDIGDLVWDTYQDDVDTRARLNTQLRLDILDDINRVYYERVRLLRDIITSNLSEDEVFKKKLRLQELTAVLDGYTGGYCSRRAEELNEKE